MFGFENLNVICRVEVFYTQLVQMFNINRKLTFKFRHRYTHVEIYCSSVIIVWAFRINKNLVEPVLHNRALKTIV